MANYTKTTDFAAKDTLPGGDTNKVVRGSEFETEFDAISTAIATKSDTASPTFTGTVTIPTVDINAGAIDGTVIGANSAAAGTFTNLTATTADINAGTIDNAVIGGSTAAAGTFTNLVATTADINGGTVDGATIGGSSAGAGTFTNLTASGTVNFSGATVSNLGTITTANLDGGTADNIVIGGSTPAAGTFTSVVATTADINGGTADNVVIGGSTAAAGTFTTLAASSATVGGSAVLTSVAFSDLQAGAVTTSGETFADSDTQIPTNAAVKDHVEAVIPALSVTEASVTQHQAALSITASQLSDVTSTAAELNILDGVTATTAELNYVDGVTSNIQTQIDSISPSPTFTATASGALANGDPVILNSDGTVTVVSGRTSATGSTTTFESSAIDNDTFNLGSTYDSSNNRVVIVYKGPSDYAYAVVGSVSGTTITFGTPVAITSANTYYIKATFDSSNNKVVVTYSDASSGYHGHAIVGTVSGTSISFGTAVEFKDATTAEQTITFDSNSNKVVIAYRRSNVFYAIVGTVSGTSISFGSEVTVLSSETQAHGSTFDTVNNKVVLVYRDQDDSGKGKAVVGTVSGTSISFGSATEFGDSGNYFDGMDTGTVFDSSAGKVVIVYRHSNQVLHAVVGTVSGTSISFGTRVEIDSSVVASSIGASYDSGAQKIVVTYGDGGNVNDLVLNVGTVSGTSISFSGVTQLDSANSSGGGASDNVYDVNAGTLVVAHRDGSDSNKGNAVATQVGYTNLTSNNFVGISDAAYSDGATATIQISGAVDDAQSSLSAGSDYFVNNLGAIATTGTVFAGKALSTTELAVKYPVPSGMTLISSVTDVSGAASVDLTGMSDAFNTYKLYFSDLFPVSQSNINLQIFNNGTLQTGSTNYYWRVGVVSGTGTSFTAYNDVGEGEMRLLTNFTPAGPFTGEVVISRSSSRDHQFSWRMAGADNNTNAYMIFGAGLYKSSDTNLFDMTGFRIQMSSGNINLGHIALYGVS